MAPLVRLALFFAIAIFAKAAAEEYEGKCGFWAIGDSITRGNNLDGGSRASWVEEFDKLARSEYSLEYVGSFGTLYGFDDETTGIRNEGHWGWTSQEILEGRDSEPDEGNLDGWLKLVEKVDLVTIHLGTNDLAHAKPDDIVENLKKIIASIREAHPHAKFYVAKIIYANLNDDWNRRRLDLNKRIGMLSSLKNVHVVDLENVVTADNLPDKLHPNAEGAKAMAKAFFHSVADSDAMNACRIRLSEATEGDSDTGKIHEDGGLTVTIGKQGDTGLGGHAPHINLFARPKEDPIVIFAMRCFVAFFFFYILLSGDNFFVLRWTNWRNGAEVQPWDDIYAEKIVESAPVTPEQVPKAT